MQPLSIASGTDGGPGGNRSVYRVAARPSTRRDPMQMCRLCHQRKGSKTPYFRALRAFIRSIPAAHSA